jgi:hypothetical protein
MVFRTDRLHAHAGLVKSGARRRRWRPTEEVDAVIREAYRLLIETNDRQALKRAAVETGWPRFAVKGRGLELGLARVKEADWSLAEIAILRENGHYHPGVIARKLAAAGFHRGQGAVLLKRKRLALTASHLGYSPTSLARLMGIDAHAVADWVKRGMLAAEQRGTVRTAQQGGDSWFITRESARAFLFAHADEWDLRKVEKWWFLDLLTDGAITK